MNKLQKRQWRQVKKPYVLRPEVWEEWERELRRLDLEVKNEYFNRNPGKAFNEYVEKNKGE